jgi:hypothetical protein
MTHPHAKHENTPLCVLLDAELAALEANGDVQLTAAREYVVGALCERISSLFGWPDGSTLMAGVRCVPRIGRRMLPKPSGLKSHGI